VSDPVGQERLLERARRLAEELPEGTIETICRAIERLERRSWGGRRAAVAEAVGHPRSRAAVTALVECWEASASDVAAASLGLALRMAARTIAAARTRQSVELVWTGPSTPEIVMRRTEQALLDVIRSARRRLTIVSFAVSHVQSIEDALVEAIEDGLTVRLIAESPEESEGRLTFSAANRLSQAAAGRIQLYVWPRDRRLALGHGQTGLLHVKCAVADDDVLFVSSANLTGAALSMNMELGLLIRGGPQPGQVRRHFDALIVGEHLVGVNEPNREHGVDAYGKVGGG
jgi:phosphatidylserine/phosphatidylglycerophosphate/cardiolipin synthase-like enzyme